MFYAAQKHGDFEETQAHMLVRATRTLSAWIMRGLFYAALFFIVVIVHIALTSALRDHGWNGGASLFASGGAVLGVVLALVNLSDWLRRRAAEMRELRRVRMRLPSGPCCVIWQSGGPEDQAAAAMPWRLTGPMRARYPELARRLGIEGYAVAEFEIAAGGKPKNIYCVDAWPSDVFFEAAREALTYARFEPRGDEHVRFGATYRMPFVFRINGGSRLKDKGQLARPLRPLLQRVGRLVENVAPRNRQDTLTR